MMNIVKSSRRNLAKFLPFLDCSLDRDRWVVSRISEIPNGESVLDAGAGECKYKKHCNHLVYKSQDFCEYDGTGDGVAIQTKKWDVSKIDVVSDIISMPVKDSSFDNILCTEVFEHVPYPDKALSEFSRILKKGGKLILTAPFCSHTHFAPYHYCDGFNLYWYQKVLTDCGFRILEYKRNGNFFEYILQELLRLPLVLKKYSPIGVFSITLYIVIVPMVLIIYFLSKFSSKSEEQLCFGYHVLAEKTRG